MRPFSKENLTARKTICHQLSKSCITNLSKFAVPDSCCISSSLSISCAILPLQALFVACIARGCDLPRRTVLASADGSARTAVGPQGFYASTWPHAYTPRELKKTPSETTTPKKKESYKKKAPTRSKCCYLTLTLNPPHPISMFNSRSKVPLFSELSLCFQAILVVTLHGSIPTLAREVADVHGTS